MHLSNSQNCPPQRVNLTYEIFFEKKKIKFHIQQILNPQIFKSKIFQINQIDKMRQRPIMECRLWQMQPTALLICYVTTVKLVENKKELPEVTHERFGLDTTRQKKKKKSVPK